MLPYSLYRFYIAYTCYIASCAHWVCASSQNLLPRKLQNTHEQVRLTGLGTLYWAKESWFPQCYTSFPDWAVPTCWGGAQGQKQGEVCEWDSQGAASSFHLAHVTVKCRLFISVATQRWIISRETVHRQVSYSDQKAPMLTILLQPTRMHVCKYISLPGSGVWD